MVNVFVSHYNPAKSAQALPSLLCQRMCNEAVEILCAVNWNRLYPNKPTPSRKELPDSSKLPPYRRSASQRKHPMVLWAGSDRAHYIWLLRHIKSLAEEHKFRYGRDHPKTFKLAYEFLKKNARHVPTKYPDSVIKASQLEYIGAFTHKEYLKYSKDIRIQYRMSLLHKWFWLYKRKHDWGKRGLPKWAYNKHYHNKLRKLYGKPNNKLPE